MTPDFEKATLKVKDKTMICPACSNDMIVVEFQKIELDFCPNCRGVWFDSGELDLMLEISDIDDKSLGDLHHLPPAKTDEKIRKCPICGKGMAKNYIGTDPKVMIDVCRRGDGRFFDGGEVQQLVQQLPHVHAEKPGAHHAMLDFLSDVFKAK